MRAARALATLGSLLVLAACGAGLSGGSAFATTWSDDGGASIDAVRARLAGHPIPASADVAVAVTSHASRIVGLPLGQGSKWTFSHPLDARPIVAGHVVVASGGGDLFALDALTGKLLWTVPTDGLALRGAGDDGKVTVLTTTGTAGHGSALLAIARDGSIVRRLPAPPDVGAPAVVDGVAFVPWQHQYVSAIDVGSGDEVGRVLLREKTSHAWTSGGALYFGELGVFRFDDHIRDASRGKADHLALPTGALPGRPLLFRPAEDMVLPVAGATDKIRLYARPTSATEPLGFDAGRLYATYFRLVLGLGKDGKLAWVHTHGAPILGGAAARGGLVVCDDTGRVTVLDARTGGRVGDAVEIGEPVESCTVQVGDFTQPGTTAEPGPLVEQIRLALYDRDLELDTAQVMLLRDLATLPDERATGLLIRMAEDPHTPPGLALDVESALAARRTGAPAMLAALGKRYDFLHDVTTAPPVGPLAQALAAMNDKSAAPLLVAHLFDPADGDKDVRDVAQALATLATPAEAPGLLRFFAFYRDAPPDPEEVPLAVLAVIDALARVGGKDAKAAFDLALKDPKTAPAVRAKLQALADAATIQRSAPSTTPSSTSRE